MEQAKCIVDGNVQLDYALFDTELARFYQGRLLCTGQQAIIIQHKNNPLTEPEKRNLELFSSLSSKYVPQVYVKEHQEADGYLFSVFLLPPSTYLSWIISQNSALDIIEIRNVIIQLFNLLRQLHAKNVFLKAISTEAIAYSSLESRIILFDCTSAEAADGKANEHILDEMKAVKNFIEKCIPWVTDEQVTSIPEFLTPRDREILEFYQLICSDPAKALSHPLATGSSQPTKLNDGISFLAENHGAVGEINE